MKTIRETEHTKVIVLDEPGEGGACHGYLVHEHDKMTDTSRFLANIQFQKGPIQENGVNGCQIEDLLSICIDRLEGFQSGGFPCQENEYALIDLKIAIEHLDRRTKDRKNRGVEGLKQK